MNEDQLAMLHQKLGEGGFAALRAIGNPNLEDFVARYVSLCNPDRVYLSTGSPEERLKIQQTALQNGEERELKIKGHTVHFDNPADQGRDKKNTGILVRTGEKLDPSIETKERKPALEDIRAILADIMKGKEALLCFFCLGPTGSDFSIPCVQITDSSYVAHSENLLYRQGYREFCHQGSSARFFKFVHSQGEVDERRTCRNLDQRRIFIDLEESIVYSVNTQYGGNSIGLKKLAMRLAIHRAAQEGWLTEHMLVMGIHGPRNRTTYFTGAFPSLCGKTSTAMLEGESIVGDDIAYLRKKAGLVRAVNVEHGMFGIIQGINSRDDPIQWKALNHPGEVIFSNVLVSKEGSVFWNGKDREAPAEGENFSGAWFLGKRDPDGREIPASHPNARFTLNLNRLENLDPGLDDSAGFEIGGIVYGGRDSDTCVPIEESFDWVHGVITKGAILESETTAATLGREGVREWNPMSNLDFLSIPVGEYVQINLDFARDLLRVPRIFAVNYFLKGTDGNWLNEKNDKKVWFKWMELRVHDEVDALETPTGFIPKYEDLKPLFKRILNKEYSKEDYLKQFTVRIPEWLAKLNRTQNIFQTKVAQTPAEVDLILDQQRERLLAWRDRFGDYVTADKLQLKRS